MRGLMTNLGVFAFGAAPQRATVVSTVHTAVTLIVRCVCRSRVRV